MLNDFRIDLQDGWKDWIALELIFAGCLKGAKGNPCPNCHNPELWEFKPSPTGTIERLSRVCEGYRREHVNLDGIVCVGGEPLDQSDLHRSISIVQDILGKLPVFIYTGYSYEDIKKIEGTNKFPLCDYIKIGPYDPSIPPRKNSRLASGNQHVFKVNGLFLGDVVPF